MFLKALGIALIAVFILVPIHFMIYLGVFQNYFKHHPGICRQVPGLSVGSEDFQILSNGLTFVTSGLMYAQLGQSYKDFVKNNVKGRIYVVDLKKSQTEARELKFKPSQNFNPYTFRPHGISVLENQATGQHLLYVVNHCDHEDDRVDKFKFLPDSGELEHIQSFRSELFHLTNNLALTGEDKFYISDYMYYKSHLMHMVEQATGIKMGSILYYNGSDFSTVATGLFGPNGVTLSRDKRYLYVAMPHTMSIIVYEVLANSSLQLVQELKVQTSVDNLHLSQDGQSLFGGCIPVAWRMFHFFHDPKNNKCPAQVINLPLKDGKIEEEEISQVFYDQGNLISGSSIGAIFEQKLLIGSVMHKLVVCDLQVVSYGSHKV